MRGGLGRRAARRDPRPRLCLCVQPQPSSLLRGPSNPACAVYQRRTSELHPSPLIREAVSGRPVRPCEAASYAPIPIGRRTGMYPLAPCRLHRIQIRRYAEGPGISAGRASSGTSSCFQTEHVFSPPVCAKRIRGRRLPVHAHASRFATRPRASRLAPSQRPQRTRRTAENRRVGSQAQAQAHRTPAIFTVNQGKFEIRESRIAMRAARTRDRAGAAATRDARGMGVRRFV